MRLTQVFPGHSTPSRPNQPKSLAKHSLQAGRVSQPRVLPKVQYPSTDHYHRVWVRVRVGGSASGAKRRASVMVHYQGVTTPSNLLYVERTHSQISSPVRTSFPVLLVGTRPILLSVVYDFSPRATCLYIHERHKTATTTTTTTRTAAGIRC